MNNYTIPTLPLKYDLETKAILKQLNEANKQLAELKGVALTIPNENILINTLTLQEAKDSSEVENIVTTHDELYKADLDIKEYLMSAATKEVLNYREAMLLGFREVRTSKLLINKTIKEIQETLEGNKSGFRSITGTMLKNSKNEVVYTPPQNNDTIEKLMANLEKYINDRQLSDVDPLIKMAVIHHQFESIHPFYDGNGRTGRIISILYLVQNNLLDLPILYLSRYITVNKAEYYRLLQKIRDCSTDDDCEKAWQDWVLFNLKGVEITAKNTIALVKGIQSLMTEYKHILRPLLGKQYKHELLNNLFFHPYTKLEYIERDMQVKRLTATKYLNMIIEVGLLEKVKVGRVNYYMNTKLINFFMNFYDSIDVVVDSIESVTT